ncbi:MAG: hypothetical protein QHH05_09725 [Syntrophomonadaceae bacterium]|jgi:hypothetical protein|nr:hypothetical protein [Syntrophomonadaceae bacterium]MDH7498704.1 hypothetical protein [Syntrophomonadaceae bacterium]
MLRDIRVSFHNRGLRSFIAVDLCGECPRQDDKGCCGFYSPVFYPLDLAWLTLHRPGMVDQLFRLPRLTVLDSSVTVNSLPDAEGGFRCQFHSRQGGCCLPIDLRESVCRHFVCPGVGWWEEPALAAWKEFFDRLADYEIALNQDIARRLAARGLSLREPAQRQAFVEQATELYLRLSRPTPDFIAAQPTRCEAVVRRRLRFGQDWPL